MVNRSGVMQLLIARILLLNTSSLSFEDVRNNPLPSVPDEGLSDVKNG